MPSRTEPETFSTGTTSPWNVALENQTLGQAPNNDTCTGRSFNIPAGDTARFTTNRNFGSILITQATTYGTINGLSPVQTGTVGNSLPSWIGTFSVGGLTEETPSIPIFRESLPGSGRKPRRRFPALLMQEGDGLPTFRRVHSPSAWTAPDARKKHEPPILAHLLPSGRRTGLDIGAGTP